MAKSKEPSLLNLNIDEFRDKVLGCWTGKNIGGTLGAPFEGGKSMNDVSFYVQDLKGRPEPNDDLDLQLVWLRTVEENGVYQITPRLLAEYWMNYIIGPWNEYGVCKANIAAGLYPPLSGSCNNQRWKYSNGAWIRSEIWACLFAGAPDEAARLAYMDACCDHDGEGIYAEMFTASLQAAAFVISDVRELIQIALSKVPADCRIAQNVNLACKLFDDNVEFREARECIVSANADLGWFQAPANIAFTILALLYGGGDFGKTVCLATNCGDDTDCTAATAGALLGIIHGRSGLPEEWIEPIGNTIETIAIERFKLIVPETLDELTERVISQALLIRLQNPQLMSISANASRIVPDETEAFYSSEWISRRIWSQSPYALVFDLPYGELVVDYLNSPEVSEGQEKQVTVRLQNLRPRESIVYLRWELPEGWSIAPSASASQCFTRGYHTEVRFTIRPGKLNEAFTYVPLKVHLAGRLNSITLQVPFQTQGSVRHCTLGDCGDNAPVDKPYWDALDRQLTIAKRLK